MSQGKQLFIIYAFYETFKNVGPPSSGSGEVVESTWFISTMRSISGNEKAFQMLGSPKLLVPSIRPKFSQISLFARGKTPLNNNHLHFYVQTMKVALIWGDYPQN